MVILELKNGFEASHKIKDYNGKCSNIHGHNYKILVHITGDKLNNNNILLDAKVFKEFLDRYDHKYLNDVFKENNVTVEYMVERIGLELQNFLNQLENKPVLKFILIEENEKTNAFKKYILEDKK